MAGRTQRQGRATRQRHHHQASLELGQDRSVDGGVQRPARTDEKGAALQIRPHSSKSRTPSAVIATLLGGSPAPTNQPLTSA
jgi:hypothetical protein